MDNWDNQILISVVVPIYNIQEYVEKCIDSIINQSYTNLEIILVDDGSTDGCPVICDRYEQRDERIKVIHKKNGGQVSARKAGVNIARGQYILHVDGDDWIDKDRVLNVVRYLQVEEFDMMYISGYIQEYMECHTEVKDEVTDGTYYGEQVIQELFPKIISIDKCFKNNIRGMLWMWVIRKEILQKVQVLVDDRLSMGEDYICIWLCLLRAKSVRLIHESGYYYVQRSTSLSYSAAKDEKYKLKVWYQQLKHSLELSNAPNAVMKAFVFFTIRLVMMADYSLLLNQDREYLFPYTKVRRKSKIVIYGAGKIGYHLIYALRENQDYIIVGLIDQDKKRLPIMGFEVNPVSSLVKMNYDYVVIAILDEDIARSVSEQLNAIGIEKEKIALMDYRVITDSSIPKYLLSN